MYNPKSYEYMNKSPYQLNYASGRRQMYDLASRKKRAIRIIKTLEHFLGKKTLGSLVVLDIGSSTGIIDSILAEKFKKVIGCDIDLNAISFAKENFKKKNLSFKLEDAMKLTFPKESFDVVICAQVYEHVPNPGKMFAEIHRVLKKGGVCYLAALNRLWPIEPHYNLPFLSYLPKSLANIYVKLMGKASNYYETTMTYWGLTKLTNKFLKIDYTTKILAQPKKFGYQTPPILRFLASCLKYFTPTFFWILVKK